MNNYGWNLIHSVEDPHEYGIPEEKKFPLDTKDHVISAIRFFNYAKPQYRKELARRIISKMKKYGIVTKPTSTNSFYNYYPNSNKDHIAH